MLSVVSTTAEGHAPWVLAGGLARTAVAGGLVGWWVGGLGVWVGRFDGCLVWT